MAQTSSNTDIEIKLDTTNTSNLFASKNDVNVGIKEYAHSSDASTMKNHESVPFTARLQMKQIASVTAYDIVGIQNQVPLIIRNLCASCFIFLVSASTDAVTSSCSLISNT